MQLGADVELREIKASPPTAVEIDRLAKVAGSYEAILNKRARKYNARKYEETPDESTVRGLLLEDYTFLKRPILELDDKVIAGNSKTAISQMAQVLS